MSWLWDRVEKTSALEWWSLFALALIVMFLLGCVLALFMGATACFITFPLGFYIGWNLADRAPWNR